LIGELNVADIAGTVQGRAGLAGGGRGVISSSGEQCPTGPRKSLFPKSAKWGCEGCSSIAPTTVAATRSPLAATLGRMTFGYRLTVQPSIKALNDQAPRGGLFSDHIPCEALRKN